jgi:NitT/TauT family transport system ATP-binding protein
MASDPGGAASTLALAAKRPEIRAEGGKASVAVQADELTKRFGAGVAVDRASFAIRANNFVSIVGPSGCGKSTLLRMVAGLIAPTSGRIGVRGREVRGPISDVGMVFQTPVLLPWRTTIQNILFVAEMGGQDPARHRARALDLIKLAGLDGFEESYPHELSGGMQQRAAICRALLLEPALILMDEPFGALDVMTRERLGFELQKIWSANRNTVLFVTHSITEAVLLSDSVIVMTARPGRIRDIIDIDLPRPRDPDTLRNPRFIELSALVRNEIGTQWAA